MAELRNRPQLCASRAVFTAHELAHVATRPDPVETLAGLFASKEAFIKAVSGLPDVPEFMFTDIEIRHGPNGAPRLGPRGGLSGWRVDTTLSISHSGGMAGAVVILIVHDR